MGNQHNVVIGLALLLTLVSIAVGISCCHVSHCCGKPYYWWEYQQMYLEEVERLLLTNLKDSANRRAEDNFGSETDGGSAEDTWEHISSVGFAKIQYPDDFRAAPRTSGESRQNQQEAMKEEEPPQGGREETQQSDMHLVQGELGILSEQGTAEPPVPTAGVNGQAGQTEAEPAPGQAEAGKPGWRTRLRGHLLEIKKSLRRALGSTLKKPHYPKA
eukprot:g30675.t1